MKERILAKLLEVKDLLALANCDGEPVVDSDVESELSSMLNTLIDSVDYYID